MTRFNPDCRLCPRLAGYLQDTRKKYPDYFARPVPPFGGKNPGLLIVGLAPGMHGANATGRPFTGDFAGILLYETLYKFGFANQPQSTNCNDGLKLYNCRITNAVKCVPPANKPEAAEINTCNRYLQTELAALKGGAVVLALGRIAHNAVVKAFSLQQSRYVFAHGYSHPLPKDRWLLDSYHCSRYNTQTRRLTAKMFQDIFYKVNELLNITN